MSEIITIDSTDEDDDNDVAAEFCCKSRYLNESSRTFGSNIETTNNTLESVTIDSDNDDEEEKWEQDFDSSQEFPSIGQPDNETVSPSDGDSDCLEGCSGKSFSVNCKNGSVLEESSSISSSNFKHSTYREPYDKRLSETVSDRDDNLCSNFGRLISRSYINSFPLLSIARMHSALSFMYCKNVFEIETDLGDVSSTCFVKPLQYSFDDLFEILCGNVQNVDPDWPNYTTFVERWISHRTEISKKIAAAMIKSLRQSKLLSFSFSCYRVLMSAVQLFPSLNNLPFSSSEFQDVIDDFLSFHCSSDFHCIGLTEVNTILILAYMISSLETELVYCNHVSKQDTHLSSASSWLSAEKKYTFVKRIIKVFPDVLKCQESYLSDSASKIRNANGSEAEDLHQLMVSESTLLLQRLLVMSHVVSTYSARTADRMATDIAAEYVAISSLSQRCLFLDSLVTPMVRLKVSQRILERQFSRPMPSGGVHARHSFSVLLNKYLKIEENVDEQCMYDSGIDLEWLRTYANDESQTSTREEVCEEYAVMLYSAVQSFLQLKMEGSAERSHSSQNALRDFNFSEADFDALVNLPSLVDHLHCYLQTWICESAPLTAKTSVNLLKIACLSDLLLFTNMSAN